MLFNCGDESWDRAPYIQFYPTLRCNEDCSFCFNRGIPPSADMGMGDMETMLSVLKEAGVRCIDILGGEPTLHPALIPFLDAVRAKGMRSTMSSNGTDVPLLDALSERYEREFLRIGISLNSRNIPDGLHDYIVRRRPILKSVATSRTTIPEIGKRYLALPGIEYFLLYMDAVSAEDLKDTLPFHRFHKELKRLKGVYERLDGVFCSGFILRDGDDPSLKSVRCPAGTAKLSIAPDGSVYPCYLFFRHREFLLGNILRDDFRTIRHSPVLDYFRTSRGNTCPERSCALLSSCRGGCPAVSYIFHGDCDAPDPRCVSRG